MTKILIATLYSFEPIMATATKISAERLFLLIDKNPDDKQSKSLQLIKQSLGSVLEIKTIPTDVYDIVEVAKESVKVIDYLSDKDEIYIDITAGRKTKALGLLFGSYARSDRIKRIFYVREESKQVMNLPKLSYNITSGQNKIIGFLLNNKISSMADFSKEVDISRAMLYKNIKQLKAMDIIEETKNGFQLTDYGRIVIL
jgi:CRISPR-associated protein Csa3